MTSPTVRERHTSSSAATCSSAGRWAWAASSAALIAPALVPTYSAGRMPCAANRGSTTDITPAS
jgi:hypothetical protein